MTDLPSMPAIGETTSYLGGSITCTHAMRFVVSYADGRPETVAYHGKKAEIRYTAALNMLRSAANLTPLKLPCLYCLQRPRRGNANNNSFCSGQCEALYYGHPVPKPRKLKAANPKSYTPREEQPLPPLNEIMETLSQYHHDPKPERVKPEPAEKLPAAYAAPARISAGIARREADKLIRQRGGNVPREGYCRPERYEVDTEPSA